MTKLLRFLSALWDQMPNYMYETLHIQCFIVLYCNGKCKGKGFCTFHIEKGISHRESLISNVRLEIRHGLAF